MEPRKPQRGTLSLSPESSTLAPVDVWPAMPTSSCAALHLTCNIRTTGRPPSRFSVIWQLVDRQNRVATSCGWTDGTVEPGTSYWERQLWASRWAGQPNSFSLSIFNTRKEDEAEYECHVTEWVRAVDNEWQIVGERRASTLVSITALGK